MKNINQRLISSDPLSKTQINQSFLTNINKNIIIIHINNNEIHRPRTRRIFIQKVKRNKSNVLIYKKQQPNKSR